MPKATRTKHINCRCRRMQWARQISTMCFERFQSCSKLMASATNLTVVSRSCSRQLATTLRKRTTSLCWSHSWSRCPTRNRQLTSTQYRDSSSFWRRCYMKSIDTKESKTFPSFKFCCLMIHTSIVAVSAANIMRKLMLARIALYPRRHVGRTWCLSICASLWVLIWYAASICQWILM